MTQQMTMRQISSNMLCVGELTTDKTTGNYTYWVFDAVMFDGVNLIDVSFKGRLDYLPKVVLRLQKIFFCGQVAYKCHSKGFS